MVSFVDFAAALTRTKHVSPDNLETKLDRCYGISDLIYMGIGFMVGTGIFVLAGEVVHTQAGNGASLSFLLAGIAAMLSALCYAEFGGLVPVAGSGYVYTYVVVGEVWAFAVGWTMTLEYLVLASGAAKAWSGTLDSMTNHSISRGIEESIGSFHVPLLSTSPDFMAFALISIVTIFVCIGAKTSSNFNKVLVTIKLLTITIIVIAGTVVADLSNWTDGAKGGFAPFGVSGILTGTATCFYAYIGFDALTIAGEETKNPKKSIPISLIASMTIVTLLYVVATMVLTLIVPYDEIVPSSPFSSAFHQKGNTWAEYVVGIGSMFGLTSVSLGALFALPRVLYAMSKDGLLFGALSNVHEKTRTPILSVIISGITTGLMCLFLDLTVILDMASIGTLMAFAFVAGCVIILRYSVVLEAHTQTADLDETIPLSPAGSDVPSYTDRDNAETEDADAPAEKINLLNKFKSNIRNYINTRRYSAKTVVIYAMLVMLVCMLVFLSTAIFAFAYISGAAWWAILLLLVSVVGIVSPLILIGSLEQVPRSTSSFKVPLVPFLPALSIFVNVGLMMMLNSWTWVRLVVWLAVGLIIYFVYGIRHSKENYSTEPAEDTT